MQDKQSLRAYAALPARALRALARPARSASTPTRVRTLALRPIALQALGWWATIRVAYLALTMFVVSAVERRPITAQALLDSWWHWDSTWYTAIATSGYDALAKAGFFPLYPLLISLLMRLPGISPIAAALVIANLASLGAMFGVGLLAAIEAGTLSVVPRTLLTLAAYPVAFFLMAPYSEGLFLGTAVFAVLFARQGRWRWATIFALLAGLTRPTGLALVPALLWEYGRQHGWWVSLRRRGHDWRAVLHPRVMAEGALLALAVPAAVGGVAIFDW